MSGTNTNYEDNGLLAERKSVYNESQFRTSMHGNREHDYKT